jgi:DNA polymerase-3 subunit delta
LPITQSFAASAAAERHLAPAKKPFGGLLPMPEITYKEIDAHLKSLSEKKGEVAFAPVYLIFGEEFICQSVFEKLLDAMLPPARRELNFELLDDAQASVFDLVERLTTYSMMPGPKVVAVRDSRVFHSRSDAANLLTKARAAYDAREMEKAARALAAYVGLLGLCWEDLRGENRNRLLKIDDTQGTDHAWLEGLVADCRERGIAIPPVADSAEVLQKAVEKGFPGGNHLILTSDTVDRRRTLFKVLLERGLVVDCAVPGGERKADKAVQESVLRDTLEPILRTHRKTLDPDAYRFLCALTGFDLRAFSQNLDKLVLFVGERRQITLQDVERVAQRSRKDPIYQLTNALAERNLEDAWFYLGSLLADNFHPLQILTALVNQVRKLLLAKAFAAGEGRRVWQPGMGYGQFTSSVMPVLQASDQALAAQITAWNDSLTDPGQTAAARGAKNEKTAKAATDLVLAKNPRSPYPAFQLLLRAASFSEAELLGAIETLNTVDLQLKTAAQNPRLLIEAALLEICGSPGASPAVKAFAPDDGRGRRSVG